VDEETKAHFGAMESRIVTLLEHVADSLKNEMGEFKNEMVGFKNEMIERFDRLGTRMDRIGGLVNGGARAITRMIEWSERTDQFQIDTMRRLNDLDRRVSKIEEQKNGH